jgi:hypothetical protein
MIPKSAPLREGNAYKNVSNPCVRITDSHQGEATTAPIRDMLRNDLIANFRYFTNESKLPATVTAE